MSKHKQDRVIISVFLLLVAIFLLAPSTHRDAKTTLAENRAVYDKNQTNSLKEVYITVLPADRRSKQYGYTFRELEQDIQWRDDKEVSVKVLFQEGQEGSPRNGMYGYGLTKDNGLMTLRGRTTRLSEQKSYKIRLDSAGGPWNGSKIINLNKHPFDPLKVRNKLSFDYLKEIPGITSLRTQYVHVFLKDYSTNASQRDWLDYGLFVQVENMDTDFLKNHGLDPEGNLYQAESFTFRELDRLRNKKDEHYSRKNFEAVLDIKGSNNHEKLIQMLRDVNNQFTHIDGIFQEHFDRDNYLTWLAVNILMGNIDTNSQNFYLYSPGNSKKWYFLPWDYDGAWGFYDQSGAGKTPWQEGISNYWGTVLHQRFFQNPNNIKDLSSKVDELARVLAEEKTTKLLNSYKQVILPLITREPDRNSMFGTKEKIEAELARLPGIVQKNREIYYRNLQKPMPVHLGEPQAMGDYYLFTWDKSFDLQGDPIRYKLEISTTPGFEKVIKSKKGIRDTQYILRDLPPGKYYWRLSISDSKGNTMIPFDIFKDENGKRYFGIREFHALQ